MADIGQVQAPPGQTNPPVQQDEGMTVNIGDMFQQLGIANYEKNMALSKSGMVAQQLAATQHEVMGLRSDKAVLERRVAELEAQLNGQTELAKPEAGNITPIKPRHDH